MVRRDVIVIGSGVAGLTAGIFTARAGMDTVCIEHGESILARNAHLENYPGFPAGVNARLLLEMMRDQADRNGVGFLAGEVTALERLNEEFTVHLESGETSHAPYVLCASWADPSYLSGLDVGLIDRGSKTFIDVDERGWTGVDGLYAAGRIAETHHQTIVSAGDGAAVALSLIEDSAVPFYHDWVAPEGYFTNRGRDVPPGCEEIDAAERRRRERESLAVMREYVAEPHSSEPTQHPSVATDD